MTNNQALLNALLAPQSVAIVGASDVSGRAASRPFEFLYKHKFEGRVYAVNPRRETVAGHPCYPMLADLPEPIQHATILVGSNRVEQALADCIQAGAKVVSVFADGFADAGDEGLQRQTRLQAMASQAGVLLIGPNSTGVVCTGSRFFCTTNAAFSAASQHHGRFAVLSQSGSIIGTLYSRGEAAGIGFSTLISVGNEVSSIGQLGQLILDDPGTDGFMLFLETLRERDQLRDFAIAANRCGKPVVAYLIGQSHEGQQLSVSHTGALLGAGTAIDSYLAACGIHRVDLFDTLLEAPAALCTRPLNNRPKTVTVVSTTGGGGAMVIDQLSVRGVEISGCSDTSRNLLESEGITLGTGKLVDVTMAGTRYEIMKRVVSVLLEDPHTGVLVVAVGSSAQFNAELAVQPVIDAVAVAGSDSATVMAFPLPHAPESLAAFRAAGIAAFRSVESCAESIALLLAERHPPEFPCAQLPRPAEEILARLPRGIANEHQASQLREALGISGPPSLFIPAGEALPESLPFDWPVAVKLVNADIAHKSDIGAVVLNVESADQLHAACVTVTAAVEHTNAKPTTDGVLIQHMIEGTVAELLFGYSVDPVAGPVVSIATGGIYTEIFNDAVTHPAPLSLSQARRMIDELRGVKLLHGYRGAPRADIESIAVGLVQFSQLAECEQIEVMELNPVLALPDGIAAVDALLRLAPE
jgi:acyl-CoA synthetase (NDP forming)